MEGKTDNSMISKERIKKAWEENDLVRVEVCSLRVGRQTGAWGVPQTPQKRRDGDATCLGGQ